MLSRRLFTQVLSSIPFFKLPSNTELGNFNKKVVLGAFDKRIVEVLEYSLIEKIRNDYSYFDPGKIQRCFLLKDQYKKDKTYGWRSHCIYNNIIYTVSADCKIETFNKLSLIRFEDSKRLYEKELKNNLMSMCGCKEVDLPMSGICYRCGNRVFNSGGITEHCKGVNRTIFNNPSSLFEVSKI